MDFEKIKELIKLLNTSNIGEFKFDTEEVSLSIRTKHYYKNNKKAAIVASPPATIQQIAPPLASPAITPPPNLVAPPPVPAPETAAKKDAPAANAKNKIMQSPMIGTFYRSAGPDKPPYVKIGDVVQKGDVLCIVEAMKLFNEIESEYTGRIVQILQEDSMPVEYDQPLFVIEPV